MQQRLQQAGYDSTLADPYFDRLEAPQAVEAPGGGEGLPSPTSDFLSALQQIGVAVPGVSLAPEQEKAPEAETGQQEPGEEEQEVAEEITPSTVSSDDLPIFGRNVFAQATSEFQPVTTGPVDSDYRLGPEDQIILVLTGDVELAYTLDVGREGFLIIPDVGQVSVNGLTLGQLESRLYDRLGRVYSGVERGAEATTHINVSLGRLRTKQVYLIGDVENPGAYQVSSVSRVFNALYNAGGPTTRGSFRIIQVRRGGDVIRKIDIYDYLLRGEAGNDIRLEQGDIVFVPMAGPRVSILGQVRRQAVFELREAEGLRAALEYAGGFQADAFVQRVQIDRILSPKQRMPGHERVVIDIDLPNLYDDEAASVSLNDGDVIRVFGISDERSNRVTIRGEIFRPGPYEYISGMTVHGLVQRADGLLPDAYTPVAHVLRVDPEDGTYTLHRLSLDSDSTGAPVEDLDLQDLDEVVVYGQASLVRREAVEIAGPVRRSGPYPFAEGMTLRDLVLAAGGTEIETFPDRAHVARLREDLSRELLRYELDPDDMGIPLTEIPLEPGDRVSLFNRSDLLLPQDVSIYGLVKEPGTYSLAEGMTVEDLILTAGGFRKGARSLEVEVARLRISPDRVETIASVIRVALRGGTVLDDAGAQNGTPNGTPNGTSARVRDVSRETGPDWTLEDWSPAAEEFALKDGDRVFVR